jgi:hypothetical protein
VFAYIGKNSGEMNYYSLSLAKLLITLILNKANYLCYLLVRDIGTTTILMLFGVGVRDEEFAYICTKNMRYSQ